MSDKTKLPETQDGFDLIEYPCDYSFKAMCKVGVIDGLHQHLSTLVLGLVKSNVVIDLRSTSSRTGKFESVTIVVNIISRDELEAVYQGLAAASVVVMTL